MEWWQVVALTAIVVIIGVAGEVYIRLTPQRELRNEGRQKAREAILNELQLEIVNRVKAWKPPLLTKHHELTNSRFISAKLRSGLVSIADLARDYDEWRHEAWMLVNAEIRRISARAEFTQLNKTLSVLISSGLEATLSGYDGHYSEPIYQAIYQGNLAFELARDAILTHRWETSAKIDDDTVKLKDAIEGAQFHKIIEELKQLHGRKTFKMLRESREMLLDKAQLLLKEVS